MNLLEITLISLTGLTLLIFIIRDIESSEHFIERRIHKKLNAFYLQKAYWVARIIPVNVGNENIFVSVNDGKYTFFSGQAVITVEEKYCEIILNTKSNSDPILAVYKARYKNCFIAFFFASPCFLPKPRYIFNLPTGANVTKGEIVMTEPEPIFVSA